MGKRLPGSGLGWLSVALFAGLLGGNRLAAGANRPLCRIEQPSVSSDGIRALVTQVDLQGQLLPDPRVELEFLPGQLARPIHRRPLSQGEKKLYFVLLVEGSSAYAPATDAIRAALRGFLRALPPESQGELWQFGNRVEPPIGFRPLSYLQGLVDRYSAVSEGELQLVRAVRQGQSALTALPDSGARRVLVVLADGYNPVMDRRLFQEVGIDLAEQQMPIFPVAFSPRDVRGPLRNLGELARHGGGTARWARTLADLEPQFAALARELISAEVVTFDRKLWRDQEGGPRHLRLRCGDGYSNTCQVLAPSLRRSLWWLLGLGAAGLAVAAGLTAWWSRQRRKRPPLASPPTLGPALVGLSGILRGQTVPLGNRLTLGIGLSGPQTCTLGEGPSEPLCELRFDRTGQGRYVVSSSQRTHNVFVNGMKLLGAIAIQDQDRIQIGDLAEFVYRDQIGVSGTRNIPPIT